MNVCMEGPVGVLEGVLWNLGTMEPPKKNNTLELLLWIGSTGKLHRNASEHSREKIFHLSFFF